MFSSRVPADLTTNRITSTLQRLRAAGIELVDLTESNPTRAGFEYPRELLSTLADPRALVYDPHPFGLPQARAAVSADYKRRGTAVDSDRIVLTASTSEAYSLLFKLLCDAGDAVLVPRPSYPLFEHLTRFESVTMIPYDLEYQGRWSIDLESVRRALTPGIRAVLLVNPNNPTGSFVKRDEVETIAALCAPGVAMIGDEVFADYPLTSPIPAAATVFSQDRALAFSLGGLSKSVGLPQFKLAWIAVGGPAELVQGALERLELLCDTYLSVATAVQIAADRLLSTGASVREQILARVTANYADLMRAVAAVPSCRVLDAEAGWYAILQVPATRSEEALIVELMEEDRLYVQPGYFFDFVREAFVVVSLLPPPAVFAEAISRLLRRVDAEP
jgi:aspartate/methionine/tyrosine aminotransferase